MLQTSSHPNGEPGGFLSEREMRGISESNHGFHRIQRKNRYERSNMILNTKSRTAATSEDAPKRKGKSRPNRVGIPIDPEEYEARRINAQRAVDRYHGPGRYRVVGEPGEMLYLVNWVDFPLLSTTDKVADHRPLKNIAQVAASHAA